MPNKIIEHYSYEGFNIVIDAGFESNVFDYSLVSGITRFDVVHLRLTIYNPIKSRETTRNKSAQAYGKIIEYRWFRDNIAEEISILQDYEHKLTELNSYAIEYVKEQIYNKEITDGLPDSLKGL